MKSWFSLWFKQEFLLNNLMSWKSSSKWWKKLELARSLSLWKNSFYHFQELYNVHLLFQKLIKNNYFWEIKMIFPASGNHKFKFICNNFFEIMYLHEPGTFSMLWNFFNDMEVFLWLGTFSMPWYFFCVTDLLLWSRSFSM